MTAPAPLLGSETRVVNVGLALFAEALETLGVPVVSVEWRPAADGDARLAALLARAGDDVETGP